MLCTPNASPLRRGQGEVECCAFIDFAFSPDFAPMTGDDALDISQADAGAIELVHPVQTLEGGEKLTGVAHVEAGAVIAHEEHPPPVLLLGAKLDQRLRPAGSELP